MKANPNTIHQLLQMALEKANISGFGVKDFQLLADEINADLGSFQIHEKYYYTLFKNCQIAISEGQTEIGFNRSYLDSLAQFCGYDRIEAFEPHKEEILDERLVPLLGNWYSIVRANSGPPFILMAPVQIIEEKGKVRFLLKGIEPQYWGEMVLKKGILYCTVEGENSKSFHFVFRLGFAKRPKLLKGVFSGVSSGGDPIAGREVLWRWNHSEFAAMQHFKLPLQNLSVWPEWVDPRIGKYFSEYEKTCIKATPSSTFTLDDLELLG